MVEDETKISALLKDYLEKSGYSVVCLSRGDQVVAEIRRKMPDLILLDTSACCPERLLALLEARHASRLERRTDAPRHAE